MDWKERKKCDERQRRTSELQFAHKYTEILILNILLKRRVNYVHSCFAYARIVFLFSLMDKSKSKSKRFSPYCFSFVVLGIWNSNTASACCHIALHLLYSEFDCVAEKRKTDDLQIKISNDLLTCCISTESCLYNKCKFKPRLPFDNTERHQLLCLINK